MSDGCEMYGQWIWESLLARRMTLEGQVVPRGSRWVGILLIGGAIAPLGLAAIVATERVSVTRTSDAVIEPVTGVTVARAPADLAGPEAPMAARSKQISPATRARGNSPRFEKSGTKS